MEFQDLITAYYNLVAALTADQVADVADTYYAKRIAGTENDDLEAQAAWAIAPRYELKMALVLDETLGIITQRPTGYEDLVQWAWPTEVI